MHERIRFSAWPWICGLILVAAMSLAAARLEAAEVLTFIDVRADAQASAARALGEQALQLQKAQPQRRVLVLEELDRPGRLLLLESTAVPQEASLAPLLPASLDAQLLAPPDRRVHAELAASTDPRARRVLAMAGAAHLYVIAHVDLFPPVGADAQRVLAELARAARGSTGNLGFEVWQQSGHANHFDLVSAWESLSAWERFRAQDAYRSFRQSIGARLGSPYVDREYRAPER